jgi:hypothetical protein
MIVVQQQQSNTTITTTNKVIIIIIIIVSSSSSSMNNSTLANSNFIRGQGVYQSLEVWLREYAKSRSTIQGLLPNL